MIAPPLPLFYRKSQCLSLFYQTFPRKGMILCSFGLKTRLRSKINKDYNEIVKRRERRRANGMRARACAREEKEKKMKRILALLLAVAMVFTLAACWAAPVPAPVLRPAPAVSAEAEPTYAETKTADVIVIGAGGGGLSAANEATVNGAESVIIVEMTGKTGGSLNFTSGSMACAESVIQKEDGVEDTQESFVQDILKNGSDFGGKPNEAMVREFVPRTSTPSSGCGTTA